MSKPFPFFPVSYKFTSDDAEGFSDKFYLLFEHKVQIRPKINRIASPIMRIFSETPKFANSKKALFSSHTIYHSFPVTKNEHVFNKLCQGLHRRSWKISLERKTLFLELHSKGVNAIPRLVFVTYFRLRLVLALNKA